MSIVTVGVFPIGRRRDRASWPISTHDEITRRASICFAGGTVTSLDIAKQAADKGFSFEGDRRTRSEFCRRITLQLTNMTREGTCQKDWGRARLPAEPR